MEKMSSSDILTLTGYNLTIRKLVQASRRLNLKVSVSDESIARMTSNRAFAEKLAARGDHVYGLTTGVGVRKNRLIPASEMADYNQRMLRDHATGQGNKLPSDVVTASTIILLNTLAAGRSNVRPEIAIHIAKELSQGNTWI